MNKISLNKYNYKEGGQETAPFSHFKKININKINNFYDKIKYNKRGLRKNDVLLF